MNRALWYLALGVVAFVAFGAAMAPASMVRLATDDIADLSLNEVAGTLWNGTATAVFRGTDVGRVQWSFDPASLLSLAAGFDWSLLGDGHELVGRADAHLSHAEIEAQGVVRADSVNRLLEPYNITLEGDFTIDHIDVLTGYDGAMPKLDGEVFWQGGETRYRLAGRPHAGALPPMRAYVSSESGEPTLVAYAVQDDVPLIHGRIDRQGWVNIGITKRFTKLVGQPWPGSEPDHAVVLEVGEKLL